MCQGSNNRHNALLDEGSEHLAVGTVDVAHEAPINLLYGTFVGVHNVAVGACEAQCIGAARLQARNDILVHKATVDHCYHLKGSLVGDATTIDHAALDAQLFGNLGSRAAATVNEHFVTLDGRETVEKSEQRLTLFDNLAAYFYNCDRFLHFYLIY